MGKNPTYDELLQRVKVLEKLQEDEMLQQKKLQESLAAALFNYETIFNNAPFSISYLDLEMRIVKINPLMEKLIGFKSDEVEGRYCYDVWGQYAGDDKRKGRERICGVCGVEKVLNDGKIHTYERRVADSYVKVIANPVKDIDGTVIGALECGNNITEKKRDEEALRKSEEKFRTMADFTYDWEYWTDPDDKFIYVSPSVKRITGYTANDFYEDAGLLLDLIHPDDRQVFVDHKHLELSDGQLSPLEFRLVTRTGDERWISHGCRKVYAEDGTYLGVRGNNRDITELKKSGAAKAKLQNKLMQARKMEAIATLAGGVAHDFNNALTSVIGNIELVKMDPAGHNIKECAQAVEDSAYRMADLTKQLLAYARGGKYQVKQLSLRKFIEKVIHETGYSVDEKIEIVTNLSCNQDQIMADSSQLQMVFNAILTNAIEAIGGDRGWVEISCHNQELSEHFISTHPGSEYGSYVCFTIRDNGCGMGDETLKRIFEPFYSTKFAGRGLGMAAAYGIVKNHGGYITIESEPGSGTAVQVYLPLEVPESSEIYKIAPKKTVLLIEDEEILQDVEKSLLEALGYHVLVSGNGKDALRMVEDYNLTIDIALIDVHLPDITVDMLYLKLIKLRPAMKVFLCSGSALEWTSQKALNAGAEGFMQKPFSLQKLKEMLAKAGNMS